jgi:AcrR family transcriptional regulator
MAMASERKSQASRDEIVLTLFDLFRRGGYDAVSIADISAATGLGKSSLYHHFPGGKPDMAEAVASFARAHMRARVFDGLGAEGPLARKLAAMTDFVSKMYEGGGAPCLIASMMISPNAGPRAIDTVKAIIADWIVALAGALRREGVAPAAAKKRATDAVIAIQGALVVARATGDRKIFDGTMKAMRQALMAP